MSEKLTKALEFANYRVTLNNQQDVIRSRAQSLLIYSIGGGTFTIDRGLITFVKLLIDEEQEVAVLLDDFHNPVSVELQSFYTEVKSRYFEVTNDYHAQFEKLRKARKIHNIVDIDEAK